jgi:hypothetical protein
LITASNEIKVLGLKSLNVIKEFPGHTARINDLLLTNDGTKLISGYYFSINKLKIFFRGSDGYVKVWDYKTA